MNSAPGERHRNPAKQRTPDRKKNAQKEEKMTEADPCTNHLFVFTIDADTAQIVKFETVDASGGRRELSQEEKTALVKKGNGDRIEKVLEQAFEAGIACALEEELTETQTDEPDETDDDAELRHLLLARLIEYSAFKHFMSSEALDRAIFGTLIQHAIEPAPAPAAAGQGTAPVPQERVASAQTN
jgi:hypothetical protein